jgi:hypothetical protein
MLQGRHRRRFLVKCRRDGTPQGFIGAGEQALKRRAEHRLSAAIGLASFLYKSDS